jgi:hypothetical protein
MALRRLVSGLGGVKLARLFAREMHDLDHAPTVTQHDRPRITQMG